MRQAPQLLVAHCPSTHTPVMQWLDGKWRGSWAGRFPINSMPAPNGPPQTASGPRAQASSRWPVIPYGWCSIATPHSVCELSALDSLKLSIQFPPASSPGQAWLALGALINVRATQLVLGSVGVRVSLTSLLLPWGTRGTGLSVLEDPLPWPSPPDQQLCHITLKFPRGQEPKSPSFSP